MTDRFALVVKGYPRLSETFISQEILELQRAGLKFDIISLRHPTEKLIHPIHQEINVTVHYLPEYLHHEPMRVIRALLYGFSRPGIWRTLTVFSRDLRRDFTFNRIRRLGQAVVLAHEYGDSVNFVYAHFLHTPGSVARYSAILLGKPFAISAHAKDIWTTPDWEVREKLNSCAWCVTCTRRGMQQLASLVDNPQRVKLVYHGIDLTRFPKSTVKRHNLSSGSSPKNPVHFLTVGRAVEKKGIDTLLDALALLPAKLHWRWTHIGGGPLKDDLEKMAGRLGIAERCKFQGALPQEKVLQAYRNADLFVLPCRIDPTGDRDGLPNVIVEAQSQLLAVVSTPVSGIPELLDEGKNGMMIEPDNPGELAIVMEILSLDPALRLRLGAEGEKRVRSGFNHKHTIGSIISLLETSIKGVGQGADQGAGK